MPSTAVPDWAEELLRTSRVGHLGFVDDADRPRVLPITFALAGDVVWSAIDSKPKRSAEPARVRWLRRRPRAALVVDRYDDDWERLAWVQLLGAVSVLELDDGPAGVEALTAKYEQYRDEPPPGPLLRLDVDRVLHWRAAEV
jgi:PPOX class probable F420-dependent enzyme